MMSLETLHRLNDQLAVEAAEEGLVPYVPYDADESDCWPPFPLPELGYLQPDAWERTDQTWLVDNTGHGYESEPALTAERFQANFATTSPRIQVTASPSPNTANSRSSSPLSGRWTSKRPATKKMNYPPLAWRSNRARMNDYSDRT